jgi:hypothetical protein
VVLGHGQDNACQVQQHVVVLKDRSLDGFLDVALIHLQALRFADALCGLRALVILDGLQLRPVAPPDSDCPHIRFAPVVVLEASHLAPLAEHCCDKHAIARWIKVCGCDLPKVQPRTTCIPTSIEFAV